MPLPQEQIYTTDDIYSLPEGLRAELIDGRIYYMAPPARRHQRIIGELFAVIHDYIQKKGGSCEIDLAPFAVFLEDNDQNYEKKTTSHNSPESGDSVANLSGENPQARFPSDKLNYVEPDLSVICDPKKLTDKGCQGAPDWIIEVVSPASRRMDYMIKLFKYRSAGVREYWIVDPEKNRITVYDFSANEPGIYTFSDKIKVGIYPDLSVDFKEFDFG